MPEFDYEDLIRQDWREALGSPGARRIFGRMVYNTAFNQSHSPGDALATAFNEGSRAVGLGIMHEIERAKAGESAALLADTLMEMKHYGDPEPDPD